MADLTPNNREEFWLKGVIDGETTLTPNNRKEYWLKGMVDGETNLTPNKRSEYWYKEIIDKIGSGGGGGSSDFSIAEVTITNNYGDDLTFSWAAVYDENELGEGSPAMISPSVYIPMGGTVTFKMPMYKGKASIEKNGDATLSVSGGIEQYGDGFYFVTGDGTITIS